MSDYNENEHRGRFEGWSFDIALVGAVISILMLLVLPESSFNLPTAAVIPFYKNYRIMVFVYIAVLYCLTALISRIWDSVYASGVNVVITVLITMISLFCGKLWPVMTIIALLEVAVAFMYFAESYNIEKNRKLAQKRSERAKERVRSGHQSHQSHHHHHHHHGSSEHHNK